LLAKSTTRTTGFDWVGFYRVTEPGLLKIGPYQGGHGCLVIPFDRGVCGAAARSGTDPGRPGRRGLSPATSPAPASTRSEIVLPVLDA
jgi:L-methionine (R)-S-oxide reductase